MGAEPGSQCQAPDGSQEMSAAGSRGADRNRARVGGFREESTGGRARKLELPAGNDVGPDDQDHVARLGNQRVSRRGQLEFGRCLGQGGQAANQDAPGGSGLQVEAIDLERHQMAVGGLGEKPLSRSDQHLVKLTGMTSGV